MPEAITQGETIEVPRTGGGCAQAAIETYRTAHADPGAVGRQRGEHMVSLRSAPPLRPLYIGMIERHMSNVALAKVLHVNEKEVRRMLDPGHPTKAEALERALAAMGKRVEIRVH